MAIQDNVGVVIYAAPQTTFGTPAATGDAAVGIDRVSTTLNTMKDGFASPVVRPDQQIASFRHGGQRVEGQIEGVLALSSWDTWLPRLMRQSDWATAQTAYTQATGTNVSATGSVFTFGAGSLITAGFKVGDVVRFTTIPAGGAANNNINFRITALTATTMTVFPAPTAFTVQTTFSVVRPGRKLTFGTAKPLMTLEQRYSDLDMCEVFDSMRIGGASIRIPPNGPAGISFQLQGRRGQVFDGSGSPYFTSTTDAAASTMLTGIEGGLRLAGAEMGAVSSLDIQISHNLSSQPVIGTPYVPDIFYGQIVVGGTVTALLEDKTLINAFINETAVDLTAVCYDDANAPEGFLAFNMQNVRLNGASKQVAASGGVMVTFPFQALLQAGGSSTAFDQSTLTIQRSNS
jgi:hypothetical protein